MSESHLTIGEAINMLREEFPDVTVSKLRFLETQGLITPHRSKSGFRQFDADEMRRIRFILREQRDNFLPLKVIKSKLTLWERGESLGATSSLGEPAVTLALEVEMVDRDELKRRSGLSDDQLVDLEDNGILKPDVDGTFSGESVITAAESRRLIGFGLEVRHLRTILHAAERDADLVAQLVTPLAMQHHPEARQRLTDTLTGCTDAIASMHRTILISELRDLLED